MCGRFSLGGSAATLLRYFPVQESVAWTVRYNLAPSQEVLTIVQPVGAAREFHRMRWGLIPSWAKDPAIGNRLINARAETVATMPAFRTALRERRCLILTDGFYLNFARQLADAAFSAVPRAVLIYPIGWCTKLFARRFQPMTSRGFEPSFS